MSALRAQLFYVYVQSIACSATALSINPDRASSRGVLRRLCICHGECDNSVRKKGRRSVSHRLRLSARDLRPWRPGSYVECPRRARPTGGYPGFKAPKVHKAQRETRAIPARPALRELPEANLRMPTSTSWSEGRSPLIEVRFPALASGAPVQLISRLQVDPIF